MATGSVRYDVDPALPFKYIGGDVALDLVNTVDWTDTGLVDERLVTYDGLTRWAEGAGVLDAATADALRARAAAHPDEAAAALARAFALRALLEGAFTALAAGERLAESTVRALDDALRDALAHLALDRDAAGWTWRGWGEALASPLWPVVWAAARLLASDERAQVRRCPNERCGWLFVDRSRNGLRRWCQTDVCGARAKARRYHARRRGLESA